MYINGNSFPPAHKSNKLAAQDELDLPTSRPRESAARERRRREERSRPLKRQKPETDFEKV